MAVDHFEVGVVAARRRLESPWADHVWVPISALPVPPDVAPWTPLGRDGDDELFYAGAARVELHRSETAHYRDNLTSGRPSLWVALRPGETGVELAAVSADPYEGEAMADTVGDSVEAVPMPAEICAVVAAYFEANHVEQPFFKRKRDRADAEALARRGVADRRPRGEGER